MHASSDSHPRRIVPFCDYYYHRIGLFNTENDSAPKITLRSSVSQDLNLSSILSSRALSPTDLRTHTHTPPPPPPPPPHTHTHYSLPTRLTRQQQTRPTTSDSQCIQTDPSICCHHSSTPFTYNPPPPPPLHPCCHCRLSALKKKKGEKRKEEVFVLETV